MPIIECSNNYSKTSVLLWQNCRYERNATITDSESFKFNTKITGRATAAGNIKDDEISVSLKYWSNFCRTHKVFLINCEISLILTC